MWSKKQGDGANDSRDYKKAYRRNHRRSGTTAGRQKHLSCERRKAKAYFPCTDKIRGGVHVCCKSHVYRIILKIFPHRQAPMFEPSGGAKYNFQRNLYTKT
nr:MAG TPA: hypothetical protein [Caudoviricetes sp.]